jgi:uncharacterized protein YigE (DUF2233 family)
MKNKNVKILFGALLISVITFIFISRKKSDVSFTDNNYVSYEINLANQDLQLFWKNDSGQTIGSLQNLKNFIAKKNKKLIFAMNGGMYDSTNSPQGLYIENYKKLKEIDTSSGEGNFYLKPNGIFYTTTANEGCIIKTEKFINDSSIKYATQSGPMLLIDGNMNNAFMKDSKSLNIRNGVGILPNKNLLFAMSKSPINFYAFANYFKEQGCKNALYLDGFVSRTYLPEKKWEQVDGNFGVLIAVSENK